ncbi:unnamed protein product [Brassica oleracea var. botrytis]
MEALKEPYQTSMCIIKQVLEQQLRSWSSVKKNMIESNKPYSFT